MEGLVRVKMIACISENQGSMRARNEVGGMTPLAGLADQLGDGVSHSRESWWLGFPQ